MFIHPGLVKTGTTAFQNNFLASSSEIHSCGRPYQGTHDYRKVHWMLTKAEDFELDQPFLKKWFQDQKSIAASKGKIPVLSDETLCGGTGSFLFYLSELLDFAPNAILSSR